MTFSSFIVLTVEVVLILFVLVLVQEQGYGFTIVNDISTSPYIRQTFDTKSSLSLSNGRTHQYCSKSKTETKTTITRRRIYLPRLSSFAFKQLYLSSTSLLSSTSSSETSTTSTTTTTTTTTNTEIEYQTESTVSSNSRIPIEWRSEVLSKLRNIIDPDLGADIVTLGFIKNLTAVIDNTSNDVSSTAVSSVAAVPQVTVTFDVELTTPACPVKDMFASECERYVRELDWVSTVQVTMTAQSPKPISETDVFGMSKIGSVIAVSSCKGGVGKSTTAVNLAFTLATQYGASVGIFDADLYGPSLPTMVTPDNDIVRFVGRQIAPLQRLGVKLMSFGYVNDGSAIMRGPMVTQLLDQLLTVIQWGSLDYLILDMPPGTGDVQLSLTQRLNITAAVIVTTPTQLSYTDVVRGIDMFDSVNVPCIAVVENMAYYQLPTSTSTTEQQQTTESVPILDKKALQEAFVDTITQTSSATVLPDIQNGAVSKLAEDLVQLVMDQQQKQQQQQQQQQQLQSEIKQNTRIPIFGAGHKHRLAQLYGIEHTYSVPLIEQVAESGDIGTPFVVSHPQSDASRIYNDLAKAVVQEVAKIKFGQSMTNTKPIVLYNKEQHIIEVTTTIPVSGTSSSTDDTTTTTIVSTQMPNTMGEQVCSVTTKLTTANLRRECRCASCVEELTGRQLLLPMMVSESIYPMKMYPTGNYALSIDWSDGHRSLYPYKQIKSIVKNNN